eukprot:gene1153-4372_t
MSLVPVTQDVLPQQTQSTTARVAPASSTEDAPTVRQPPRSWQGVLNWLIRETSTTALNNDQQSEDRTNNSTRITPAAAGDGQSTKIEEQGTTSPEDPESESERKAFLQNFLDSLAGRDHMTTVKESLDMLLSSDADATSREDALEMIAEEVEDINVAQDFVLINGIIPILGCLQSTAPGIQWRAAHVIANLAQNNPTVQVALSEAAVLPHIVSLLSVHDDIVRLKAISALSCMIRGSPQLLQEFLSYPNAYMQILYCLRDPGSLRLQVKALVFLHHLVINKLDIASVSLLLTCIVYLVCRGTESLSETETLTIVTAALKEDGDQQLWEHGLALIQALSEKNNAVSSRIRQADPQFLVVVESRRRTIDALTQEDKDAHREELHHMEDIFGTPQL